MKNGDDNFVAEISALGQALADPIWVRMLAMMAGGRACCDLPECGVPVDAEETARRGICVCEFVGYFGISQSKISYHLRKLKDAGLIKETRCGKWRFYSLRREVIDEAPPRLARYLGTPEG